MLFRALQQYWLGRHDTDVDVGDDATDDATDDVQYSMYVTGVVL